MSKVTLALTVCTDFTDLALRTRSIRTVTLPHVGTQRTAPREQEPYEPIDAVVKGARLLGVSDWRAVGGLTLLMSSILVVPTPVWLGGTTAAALLGSMHRRAHRSNARPALAAFIVAAGLLVFSAIAPFLVVPATGYGGLLLVRLSVIPLTACAFWFSDRDRHTVSALWFGVTVGACASGLFAIVETVVLGNARASGLVGNAISFGDLALLFGALSLALHGLVHLPSRLTVTASATAAACGVLASTMSGSRGGWVAFPVMVFGVARLHRGWLTPTRLVGVGASLLVVVASATWMSGGMPMNRASASFVNASEYASTTPAGDAAASSEGARIEAWRSAASAFRQHPVTGVGWGNPPGRVSSRCRSRPAKPSNRHVRSRAQPNPRSCRERWAARTLDDDRDLRRARLVLPAIAAVGRPS